MDFSNCIKELRVRNGITQKEVAKAIETSERNYQRYESGSQQPTAPVIIKLADYFDVSADYLLGRTDNPNSHKL